MSRMPDNRSMTPSVARTKLYCEKGEKGSVQITVRYEGPSAPLCWTLSIGQRGSVKWGRDHFKCEHIYLAWKRRSVKKRGCYAIIIEEEHLTDRETRESTFFYCLLILHLSPSLSFYSSSLFFRSAFQLTSMTNDRSSNSNKEHSGQAYRPAQQSNLV